METAFCSLEGRRGWVTCDSMHCDGCGTVPECEAVKECIWHPHEHYCHVREIKLFGHTIDLVKLHNKEV